MSSFYCIRSFNQNIQTVPVEKIALSPYDDKRYVTSHGTDTLAHGHWRSRDDADHINSEHLREASRRLGYNRSYINYLIILLY